MPRVGASGPRRSARSRFIALLIPTMALTVLAAVLELTRMPVLGQSATTPAAQGAQAAADVTSGEEAARRLCVGCHRFAPPDVLPRSMWLDEVRRMHLIMTGQTESPNPPATAMEATTLPPEMQAIARYYEARAPERLPPPAPWPPVPAKTSFVRRTGRAVNPAGAPAIANVRLVDLNDDGRLDVIAADMRHGLILSGDPSARTVTLRQIARTPHPAHVEVVDFDKDGILDLLVADLGNFLPTDLERGAVVWLKGQKDGTYVPLSLDGFPRVSDVRAADFDGDGKDDLVVAAFGWRRTGHFSILKNDTTHYTRPSFIPMRVDSRTGSIHAEPVDLNRDGHIDFIVLFSQEHETVVAFINRGGTLGFDAHTIYEAPHPNWGSSGIQAVDIDRDGDLDVLLTNGDTFDDEVVKPYHGIQLLENRGTYPFTVQRLADMPGVHRAEAADLDGDGDLDIVACALVSAPPEETKSLPSVVWLEQVSPGIFTRHTLETGHPTHATLATGDVDGDGDIDFVVGNFIFTSEEQAEIEIWESLAVSR